MKTINKILEGIFDADIDAALEDMNWSLDWIKDEKLRRSLFAMHIPGSDNTTEENIKNVENTKLGKKDLGKLLQIFKMVEDLPESPYRRNLLSTLNDPIFYIEQTNYTFKFIDSIADFLSMIDKIACKKKDSFKWVLIDRDGNKPGMFWIDVCFKQGYLDEKDAKLFQKMKDVEVVIGEGKFDHIVYNFNALSILKPWVERKKELKR